MKKVYICSPCRGDYKQNIQNALGYCRDAVEFGVLPVAPHVFFIRFLDDTIPEERAVGMKLGLELLKECKEVWVYGIENPSEGMRAEIALAEELGIPVLDAAEVYKSNHREYPGNPTSSKSLEARFENYTGDYQCDEYDWGRPAGKEVW